MGKLKQVVEHILPKGQFARGIGVLVGGTAGSQLILVVASPLLTRLYSPEDFGVLAVYGGLLSLICVVASLRYELAIPLPESDNEAANIVGLCLIIITAVALASVVIIIFFGREIAQSLGIQILESALWLLPAGVFLAGIYAVFSYWSIRSKQFGTIASTQLKQSLVTVAIQLGVFKLGAIALLFAQVAGQAAGVTGLARPALRLPEFKDISWAGIKAAATRYREFPVYSTWEGLSNTAGLQLPPLLFAALFSPTIAGFYMLANRVLNLPMSLIGRAIGQVFFSSAAESYRAGRLGPLVSSLHSKLAHIGFAPVLLLILLGPEIFVFVFGGDWRQAGEFARWMSPWLYFVFVSSPLSTLFAVVEKQKQGLVFQIILLVSRVLAIGVGAWTGDITVTIILFSSVSAFCWFGFLFWVAHIAGNRAFSMILPTLEAGLIGLFLVSPVIIVKVFITLPSASWFYALMVSLSMVVGRYYIILRGAY
ncbi:oligosaccharide flippase family protein [Zhongshania aliphaticivorans]|uniref:oligosaccharide flippase family protein n=1 Tax=Zhongshania aliphaticivorans TaxID=1470434 RepID=UPI0039C9D461